MKKILLLSLILLVSTKSMAQSKSQSIYDIKLTALDGSPIDLAAFKGKHILFVNVASKCGFTPQYAQLQELYNKYKSDLMVIGAPSNQFANQEPGTAKDIKEFCTANYGVTFLMTEKLDVKGDNQHPLYQWLTKASKNGKVDSEVKWNFQKYLVDGKGNLVDYYLSAVTPMDAKITKNLL
ncbi:glutathione peroxidase [Confluentibacter sediminis]|uniref:glutathione peroxidase n=1 Tax=Confluentibacter sediminis TaxID=2219045 RepID=UPI000DACD933|nr:glutathione peroxidase [Confluentibacter sediminis]